MGLAIVGNDIHLYMMYMHCDYGEFSTFTKGLYWLLYIIL